MSPSIQELLAKVNNTAASYPREKAIHHLASEQAAASPESVVFEVADEQLTYLQLDVASNQLANHLISNGVKPGMLVGVCCERNLDVPVVLIGIMKAGAGYVALDPDYPIDRLKYMNEDSGLHCVVAHRSLGDVVSNFKRTVICLDTDRDKIGRCETDNPDIAIDPATQVAYVIYTSGSTGKPKGVLVPHRCAVNLFWGMRDQFTSDDVMLGVTSLSFDLSVVEMFLPMVVGGRTALVDRATAKDGQLLIQAIKKHKPTFMQATATTWRFLVDAGWEGEKGTNLRIVTGGEPLPKDLIQPLLDRCDVLGNWYGPTETTVWSTRFTVKNAHDRLLVGTPWPNVTHYIVDENNQLLGPEQEGELLIGGDCVTLGYLNRDDLTKEKYIQFQGERVYRSGDLAKFTADGLVECVGRIDTQVKLHGHRIELGEIESQLAAHPAVHQAAATVREDVPGDKRLVAYLLPSNDVEQIDTDDVRRFAEEKLPEYMVPSAFAIVDGFPKTPSGKLDRKALPRPSATRPNLSPFVSPRTEQQENLARIWAEVLQLDRVGIEDNFFQVGGSSILALKAIARMQGELGISINTPELFDKPTISQLTEYCDGKAEKTAQKTKRPAERKQAATASNEFAIVGMAARLPGAKDVVEYWENLCSGKESITFFGPDELDSTLPQSLVKDPSYVPARGIVEDADKFDAPFFEMNPREAQYIDPQQRVMLEVAWSALEDAHCVPDSYAGTIGVWAGTYSNTYYTKNILSDPSLVELTGEFQMGVYNEKDYIATRLAHKLNLTGPAVNVNTACSTSLVAVIEACNSLSLGHCDVALAGGASITFPQNSGHLHQTGSIMSPDGHCRPFDAQSAGTLFSDGVAVVVVKRLADAIEDNDRIYAVIKGCGINNDGGEKASFTAPSIQGQAGAIAMAQAQANVPIESIEYVEAHGTATPIGDPIEVQALKSMFESKTDRRQFCGIGSVKSNIGHTVAAAGVAGLIKCALSLHHESIPPTLHYESANPQIDFEDSPFYVSDTVKAWPRKATPRRSAVSSFGVGGTNAHVLLEESPASTVSQTNACAPADNSNCERIPQIIPFSAKSPAARDEFASVLKQHVEATEEDVSNVAFTLQTSRGSFGSRGFAIAASTSDLVEVLDRRNPPTFATSECDGSQREVVFMFPGQGSQYVWMGKNLYDHAPVFRDAMDQCCTILTPLIGRDLRDVLYPQDGDDDAAARILRETQFTQPAIFCLGYSLAQLWKSWGIEPTVLIGHSIGEFVAACLAGVFSLEDGLRLIAERGRLMQSLPGGSMLSVRATADRIQTELDQLACDQLAIASYNGPNLCVVAGPDEAVEELRLRLDAQDIVCKELHTSHAFHSPMMDGILEPFREFVSQIQLSEPSQPILSTVSAKWLTADQATDPRYWANHMRAPVVFAQAIQQLWADDPTRVLVELGPRRTLATLARQQAQDKQSQRSIASLTDNAEHNAEWTAILGAVGQLWLLGQSINWDALHIGHVRQKVTLPTYRFQRDRHFIEPKVNSPNESNYDVPAIEPTEPTATSPVITREQKVTSTRQDQIREAVEEILETTSGIEVAELDGSMTFFEMGMDSLVLTQAAAAIKRELGVNLSFRQLLEGLPTIPALVDFLDGEIPADQFADVVEEVEVSRETNIQPNVSPASAPTKSNSQQLAPTITALNVEASNSVAQTIIQNQLQIMQQQLQLIGSTGLSSAATVTAEQSQSTASAAGISNSVSQKPSESTTKNDSDSGKKKTFGAGARVSLNSEQLDPTRQQALNNFIQQYVAKTPSSKAYAQRHRKYLADPRTVSGFKPALKEMTYPLVVERSKGAYMWDLDGNEYIDVTNGFGSNFLGHTVDFMVDAMVEQLHKGYEIGPQTPLAGEVAELFCELTGAERCAFANTGSEAVLGATRLARNTTGRDLIVMFTGDYHGILDEVIVRGSKKLKSFPAATGIPPQHVENTLVLEYGTDESLRIIEERLDEIAAIVVETVQSRRPEFQPSDFLHKLRALTENDDAALIFDEVITGFRIAAGGAQEHFGIQADLASYGKIVGGGQPIGMLAGKAKYMDGLDGGYWEFGDGSKPEAGMTYFAGTFVRHPVTMAAAKRILTYIRDEKDSIYDRINGLSDRLAREVNQMFEQQGAPLFFAHFGSLFKVQFDQELPYGELLFASLRQRGIHIWDHRPCLLTLSHTEADIDKIVDAFRDTVIDLQANGFLPKNGQFVSSEDASTQVVSNENAKLGKDKNGNPAWFVPDAENPGQFIEVPAPN